MKTETRKNCKSPSTRKNISPARFQTSRFIFTISLYTLYTVSEQSASFINKGKYIPVVSGRISYYCWCNNIDFSTLWKLLDLETCAKTKVKYFARNSNIKFNNVITATSLCYNKRWKN